MTAWTLAQIYGFEDTLALYVFFAGVGGVVLLSLSLARASLLHWLMGAVLLFTSLTAPLTGDRTAYLPTVLLPIEQKRAELHLTAGIVLSLVILFKGQINLMHTPAQTWLIFAIVVYQGLLQFIHDTPETGGQTIVFALATIPCMASAASIASGSYEGAVKTLKMIMWVSVLWTLGCAVQFVSEPAYLVSQPHGRFLGLLGNAQHAAVLVAPFATVALWLLLNDTGRASKLLWTGLLGINLLFLGWTGSRTGFLQLILGVTIVLYRRMGQAVLLVPVVGLMVWGLSFLATELEIGRHIERLVSTENTRSGLLESLSGSIGGSPWIGVGWRELGYSENSYLAGFAGYGIVMFAFMVGLLIMSMWKCARYMVSRGRMPARDQSLIEIFIAYNAMYFAGAAFEGYMLGRSSAPQALLLIFAGIGVYIGDSIRNAGLHASGEHGAAEYGAEEGEPGHEEEPERRPA